jgi:hypothetical protein
MLIRTQLLDGLSPTAVFEGLNRVLPAVKENHMYATCTAVRLPTTDSTDTMAVEYAIAAQLPILHFRADADCVGSATNNCQSDCYVRRVTAVTKYRYEPTTYC